jgi:hypothetical protein
MPEYGNPAALCRGARLCALVGAVRDLGRTAVRPYCRNQTQMQGGLGVRLEKPGKMPFVGAGLALPNHGAASSAPTETNSWSIP